MRKFGLPLLLTYLFVFSFSIFAQDSRVQKIPRDNKYVVVSENPLGAKDTVINTYPYVQSWEGTFLPTGWTQYSSSSSLFEKVTSGTNPTCSPQDGGAMVRYNSYDFSVGANSVLTSPSLTFDAQSYQLKFWMYRDANGFSDKIEVYYSIDSLANAELLGTIHRNKTKEPVVATAGWYEYTFALPATTLGSGRHIFIKGISDYGYNIFFDKLTIEAIPTATVDWCNLQWPTTHTMVAGNSVTVYAQAWINGVTSTTGATPDLQCWIGYSSTDTDPSTWTNWVEATFNVDNGNNDEFMASIGANLPIGTYYYASKFVYQGGPEKFGGNGGFWNATTAPSGVLTVTPLVLSSFPVFEGFEGDSFPPSGWKVQDLNAGVTWVSATTSVYSGTKKAYYPYSSTLPGDDYLYSAGLNLEAGKNYYVSYYYRAGSVSYIEKMRVVLDTDQDAAAITSVLAQHDTIINTSYLQNIVYFTVPTSGVYFMGFHCNSEADMLSLSLDAVEIGMVYEHDYAITNLVQVGAVPSPFKGMEETKGASTEIKIDLKDLPVVISSTSNVYEPSFSSDDASTGLTAYYGANAFTEGYTPLNFYAKVKNMGTLSNPYTFNYAFNSVPGTPISRPGVAFNEVDSLGFTATPTARGTFSTVVGLVSDGDTIAVANNGGTLFNTLVYPDQQVRIKYDNGANIPNTFIGFGANNISLTAAVRFNATENLKLANIDAFYRTETDTDSITVKVWAAGTDSLAPGTLIYQKKFAGENYQSVNGMYVTLPLGNNAPTFLEGTTFWVGISFSSAVQYPMAAHNSGFTTGHSFIGEADTAWSALVVSSTERAWMLRVVGIPYTPPQYNTVWQRSKAENNLPTWFSTSHFERGLAYGSIPATGKNVDHLFVVSRNGGTFVKVLNALTGEDVGALDVTGISGGTYALNDIGTTTDGKIIAANLILNNTTSAFKIYMWDNEAAAPVNIISYTGTLAARFGDKITVTGDYSAGTATIYAASATSGIQKILKWTMSGGSFVTEPTIISLSDNQTGTPISASVGPLPNGDFYWKATGFKLKKYTADGTFIDTLSTTILASGSNAVRYLGEVGEYEFVAAFQYGSGNENCKIVKLPKTEIHSGTVWEVTPSLGSNSNTNGSGDIAIKINGDGTAYIYVLSTNNGIGCYVTTSSVPVELTSFAAIVSESEVTLSWITATEVNSQAYIIERKSNSNWEAIGTVQAAGTSTEPREYVFTDKVGNAGNYSYRLKMVDFDGTFEYSNIVEVELGIPASFQLSQNYPNPFNPSTRINYSIPVDSKVSFELYDITGQKVATLLNTEVKAGYYTFDLSANNYRLASGVYIYRMTATSMTDGKHFVNSKKFVLLK